jgi:hypothetical protein
LALVAVEPRTRDRSEIANIGCAVLLVFLS